ncbi:hypothetical protein EBZ38_12615 [bacterium]|nr:hypothetical protein [bacterium]
MLKEMVLYILSPYRVRNVNNYNLVDCDLVYIKRVIKIVGDTMEMIKSSGNYTGDEEVFEALKAYMEKYAFYGCPETFVINYEGAKVKLPAHDRWGEYTIDGLSTTLYNVYFYMTPNHFEPYELQMLDDVDTDTLRTIYPSELETVVYPHGNWGVVYNTTSDKRQIRANTFNSSTTIRDLFKWITSGECGGYFGGLVKIDLIDYHKWAAHIPAITQGLVCYELKN